MKPNKILLRISHFFGLRKDTVHMDDIMFRIPSDYVSIRKYVSPSQIEVDDMKSQTYKYLEKNLAFKKDCSIVEQVYILFPDHSMRIFQYIAHKFTKIMVQQKLCFLKKLVCATFHIPLQ